MDKNIITEIMQDVEEEEREFAGKLLYLDAVLNYFAKNELHEVKLEEVKETDVNEYLFNTYTYLGRKKYWEDYLGPERRDELELFVRKHKIITIQNILESACESIKEIAPCGVEILYVSPREMIHRASSQRTLSKLVKTVSRYCWEEEDKYWSGLYDNTYGPSDDEVEKWIRFICEMLCITGEKLMFIDEQGIIRFSDDMEKYYL